MSTETRRLDALSLIWVVGASCDGGTMACLGVNVLGCAPPGEVLIETFVYIFFHLAKLVLLELNEERRPGWLASELAHPRPPRADSLPPQATTGLIERLSADWSPPKVGCGALTAVPMWAAPALAAPRDFADRYDELILRGRELTEAVHISRQACGVGRVHATCAAIALESGCAIVFPSKT